MDDDIEQPISKSEIKRQMTALQKLGEELVALPASKLDQLDLPETLRDAVNQAKRITAHGGLRRQMQYIGRLMRITDAQPIAEQLNAWRGDSAEVIAEFHRMENWRTRLLADDAALTEFVDIYPQADAQQLRTLVRNARREAAAAQAPKSSRALFKLIRGLLSNDATDEQDPVEE
ncbi:putative alpha helix protein [Sulfuriferula multivorans]|uniref:Dual-action ribosomal maturation protein DarP n=1 Tax=Sulfuriferula multivorans TaxID=1559896 RepID=A0A401JFA2_9PROT|nr:ribosome biogenesis factor YjgA [Sulfuriferula multivorans]GBL46311.1 putative alpha helix protein [Sulfuriferula multivorans]